ncbi:hypothetical protein [Bradyrhizobium sp. DASA03120]|uniref:hypothetical protein n=1 Tax=Bradyrhizobium sp. SMVTL-02 TaxID=3395917 RepID=UPI003F7082A6
MTYHRKKSKSALFGRDALASIDAAEAFAKLHAALMEEVKPTGVIENMYLDTVADLVWQIAELSSAASNEISPASPFRPHWKTY